jgi:hypothetical protein
MKKLLFFTFLCISIFTGCTAATLISPIVTGVVMWKDGEAHKYYNEDTHTLYRATKLSLKELDQTILKDGFLPDSTKNSGYFIIAGENDKFKITIRKVKPHVSEVKIRINLMGDKPYADLIYRQIDSNTSTIDFDDQGKPTKRRQKILFNQNQ